MGVKGKKTFPLTVFTTKSKKIPKKRGCWRSVENAKAFMYELFRKGLRKCSYETLVFEFVNFFGSNDKRTVERYLGRPEEIIRSAGSTRIVRMNRRSGKIAQFEYFNEKRVPAKKGLLDILGWILKLKDGSVLINHEVMDYYTKQTTFEAAIFSKEANEREASKPNMCVQPLYAHPSLKSEAKGEWGKLPIEEKNREVSPENMETKEKKEKKEAIDSAHTSSFIKEYALKHTKYALTPEEEAILTAEPLDSEPDLARRKCPKIRWF